MGDITHLHVSSEAMARMWKIKAFQGITIKDQVELGSKIFVSILHLMSGEDMSRIRESNSKEDVRSILMQSLASGSASIKLAGINEKMFNTLESLLDIDQ